MQETRVQSLDQKDPLEKEMAMHSSILTWRIPWTEVPWWAILHVVAKSQTRMRHSTLQLFFPALKYELALLPTFMVFQF